MRITDLEYQIRKWERGLRILLLMHNDTFAVKVYGRHIAALKKELQAVAGYAVPKQPRWPL